MAEAYNLTYSGRQADRHRIIINSKAAWASEHISVQGQPRQLSETVTQRYRSAVDFYPNTIYIKKKVSNKNL